MSVFCSTSLLQVILQSAQQSLSPPPPTPWLSILCHCRWLCRYISALSSVYLPLLQPYYANIFLRSHLYTCLFLQPYWSPSYPTTSPTAPLLLPSYASPYTEYTSVHPAEITPMPSTYLLPVSEYQAGLVYKDKHT